MSEEEFARVNYLYLKCKPFYYSNDEQGFSECVFTFLTHKEMTDCMRETKTAEECVHSPAVQDKLLRYKTVLESPIPAPKRLQQLVDKYSRHIFNNSEEKIEAAQRECFDEYLAYETCTLHRDEETCFRQLVNKTHCKHSVAFADRLVTCMKNSIYEDKGDALGGCLLETVHASLLLDILDQALYNKQELVQLGKSSQLNVLEMDGKQVEQYMMEGKQLHCKHAHAEFEECVEKNKGLDFPCIKEKINRDLSQSLFMCGKLFNSCISKGQSFLDCLVEDEIFADCTAKVQEKM